MDLPSGMTTIDSHISTGHVGTRIAQQEDRGASEVFRPTQFSQHILGRPVGPPFRILFEELFDHRSDDIAWRYRVDADTILAPF